MGLIDCLNKNKDLGREIADLIRDMVTARIAEGKKIDFDSVYGELIDSFDKEIDQESAAILYDMVRSENPNYAGAMTGADDIKQRVRGGVQAVIDNAGKTKTTNSTIKGQLMTPAKVLAVSFFNLVDATLFPQARTESTKKAIQGIIRKYGQAVLKENVKGKTYKDILEKVLEQDANGESLSALGEDLWKELKPVMDDILKEIKDPVLKDRFKNEFKKIQEASFDLGLTKTQKKKVLYDALANHPDYGKTLKNGNKVPDWNKIAASGDMAYILNKVLGDKLDELEKKGQKKDPNYKINRTKVYDALINEFLDFKKSAAYTKAFTLTDTNKSKLAKEVAINKGFYMNAGGANIVNYDRNAPLVNLNDFDKGLDWLEETANEFGIKADTSTPKGIESAINNIIDNYASDPKRNWDSIREAVKSLMSINNSTYQAKVSQIDRLVRYKNLNIGFDNVTNGIASNILNVDLNSEATADLEKAYIKYQKLLQSDDGISMIQDGSLALEQVNKEISAALLKGLIKGNLGKMLVAMNSWQRMTLSAQLTNPYNILQNTQTAISGIVRSGATAKMIKEALPMAFGIFKGDALGNASAEPNSDFKSFGDLDKNSSTVERILAGLKMNTEGVLQAIDIGGGIIMLQGMFEKMIREELSVVAAKKGLDVEKIMSAYHTEYVWDEANKQAKRALDIAGLTPEKLGQERYDRYLARETVMARLGAYANPEFGDVAKLLTPIRVSNIRDSANKETLESLGKKDTTLKKKSNDYKETPTGVPNLAKSATQAVDQQFASALREYASNPSNRNSGYLFMMGSLRALAHGGIVPFASGIWRFSVIDINKLVPIRSLLNNANNRKEYREILKGDPQNSDNLNEKRVNELRDTLAISRRNLKQSAWAWSVTAMIAGAILMNSDDDQDDLWDKFIDGIYQIGAKNPGLDKLLSRVAPLQIRSAYQWSKIHKNKNINQITAMADALFSTAPITPTQIFDKFTKKSKEDGKHVFNLAAIGKTLVGSYANIGDVLLGPSLNFANSFQEIWKGEKTKSDYEMIDNPFLRGYVEKGLIRDMLSGSLYGLIGRQLPKFLDANHFVAPMMSDIKLVKNDIIRNPNEYKQEVGKKFSRIDWVRYGNEPMKEERKLAVDEAYKNLDKIRARVKEIGGKLGVIKSDYDLEQAFNYNDFTFEPQDVDIKALRKWSGLGDNKYKSDAKSVNIMEGVLAKMNLSHLTLKDVENAIEFEKFQKRLAQ